MENWREISEDIVESLIEDGSSTEKLYEVEHHFVSEDFKQLEEAALAAFKLGYDVEDPAELELEDGSKIWGFDVVVEAEYRGRKVKLNKPMRGDVKKFKVYVKDPKTGKDCIEDEWR